MYVNDALSVSEIQYEIRPEQLHPLEQYRINENRFKKLRWGKTMHFRWSLQDKKMAIGYEMLDKTLFQKRRQDRKLRSRDAH